MQAVRGSYGDTMQADDPGRWLLDAGNSVKRHAFYMKKALVRNPAPQE